MGKIVSHRIVFLIFALVFNFKIFANEDYVEKYLDSLYSKLVKTAIQNGYTDGSMFNIEIYLDYSKEVNADSGITVNYGMINFISNEDELAAILAHELAHLILKHEEERPNNEIKADLLGTFLIVKSGYNPYALVELLTRISKSPNYVPEINGSKTHPKIQLRIQELKGYIQRMEFIEKASKDVIKYQAIVSTLYQNEIIDLEKYPLIEAKLEELEDKLYEVEYSESTKARLALWVKATVLLSEIVRLHPKIKNIFTIRTVQGSGQDFLGGLLIWYAIPAWLENKHAVAARLFDCLTVLDEIALSLSPYVGDSIDFYELVTGVSFFDGKQLSEIQRVFAGVGIILGSRMLFEGPLEVGKSIVKQIPSLEQGAVKVLNNSSVIVDSARKLGLSKADDIKDLTKVAQASAGKNADLITKNIDDYAEAARLGAGPKLPVKRVADTFKKSQYYNRKLKVDEAFYKYHGIDNKTGKKITWLVKNAYPSEKELREGLAILPEWGVEINKRTKFIAPKGTWVSEGLAAPQKIISSLSGGDYQAVISNVPKTWVVETVEAFK